MWGIEEKEFGIYPGSGNSILSRLVVICQQVKCWYNDENLAEDRNSYFNG